MTTTQPQKATKNSKAFNFEMMGSRTNSLKTWTQILVLNKLKNISRMSSDFHEAFVPFEDTWLCRIGEFVYVLDWNGVSISTIAAVISSPLDCLSTWKKSRVRCGGEFITYIMSEVVDCS